MGKKNSLEQFELSMLRTALDACAYERHRYPDNADRVFAILDAIVKLNQATRGTDAFSQAHSGLNRLLSRYEWRAKVSPTEDKGNFPFYQPTSQACVSAANSWEQHFVMGILFEMQESGTMNHLSRCESCSRFILGATAKRKRFCDQKCKQRAFDSKPENKARKRETMQKVSAKHKQDEARLKAAVGYAAPAKRLSKTR